MSKATGKLIKGFEHDYDVDRLFGKVCTIELPRGQKLIGKCTKCKFYDPAGHWCNQPWLAQYRLWRVSQINYMGCGYWKEKK